LTGALVKSAGIDFPPPSERELGLDADLLVVGRGPGPVLRMDVRVIPLDLQVMVVNAWIRKRKSFWFSRFLSP
jgi:hypothetical protein